MCLIINKCMPFYDAPYQQVTFSHSDINFFIFNLVECFSLNEKQLSVYFLQPSGYLDDDILSFIDSDAVDLVIFPQISHPYYIDNEYLEKILISKPWLHITWNRSIQSENTLQLDFWPTALDDPIYTLGIELYEPNDRKRNYIFSSLNGRGKAHRIVNLYHLFLDNLLSKCLYSMSDDYKTFPKKRDLENEVKYYSCYYDSHTLQEFSYFHPAKCPQESNKMIPFWIHDAYVNSYVNIATEHDFQTGFVSEKSIKPFLTEQLAIFIGGVNTVENLRRLGLDVFDDYIDHSYDTEPDPVLRLKKIKELMCNLALLDWDKIYYETKQRRIYNRNFLLSGSLFSNFQKILKNKVLEIFQ